ncbi:MAG: D-alanyl-D-alanine carboxypeptidase [Desulfatibacillum sp.]|nr:D-alanyl-D-alanine carboxypeptidase [Desulfatibacillum sp.]
MKYLGLKAGKGLPGRIGRTGMILWVWVVVLALGGSTVLSKDITPENTLPKSLSRVLSSGDSLLVEDSRGNIVYAYNKDAYRTPASTFKVFTSLLALEKLKPDFRFTAGIYTDSENNLKIKGFGDPLLISEVLGPLAKEIASRMPSCKQIVLDSSFFESPLEIPGTGSTANPYDAPVGALCANFNTVFFDWGPGRKPVSAEPQTPMIPFAQKIIIDKKYPKGRVLLTQEEEHTTLYAGHLLRHFLVQDGMVCRDVVLGKVEPGDTLLFTHESPYTLSEVVKKALEYSNNFIVNQVFLTVGAREEGAPATLDKAVKTARAFASEELGIKDLQIAEGSGLSRDNRIAAIQMMKVLKKFQPYHTLMHQEEGIWYKTGTLTGVSTLVGYFQVGEGQDLGRFVIFVNTPGGSARRVLDKVLESQQARTLLKK